MLDLPPSYTDEMGVQTAKETELDQALELSLDGQLIFPSTPPSQALYQISREIDIRSTSLSVSRVVIPHKPDNMMVIPSYVSNSQDDNQVLYDLARVPLQNRVEIVGKRRSTYPGTIIVKFGILAGFKIKQIVKGEKKLLYTGSVLGAEGYSSETAQSADIEGLKIVEGAERDLLVTCWCAVCWCVMQSRLNVEKRLENAEKEVENEG
ncbi:hypothetical protein G7Y89_g11556 [Cudoniella acicularis]|uniref:Uncharacterized protein n=1 Tax=Cudoniella acicularis TaxID=354080 RepID=A0A8H4REA6_9HELO|nr:hypothetical protein G7Y89_g11556 [Cudoniella acicularis]